jgi:hypothetical protein
MFSDRLQCFRMLLCRFDLPELPAASGIHLHSSAVLIVANGLRALGIIVLAHLEGNAAAAEADHVVYG